jgi:outer membrane lipoprotein SlyB
MNGTNISIVTGLVCALSFTGCKTTDSNSQARDAIQAELEENILFDCEPSQRSFAPDTYAHLQSKFTWDGPYTG